MCVYVEHPPFYLLYTIEPQTTKQTFCTVGTQRIEEFRVCAGGALSATAAIASSRDSVEFSRKNTFRVCKPVLNSRKTCFMFTKLSQEKSCLHS